LQSSAPVVLPFGSQRRWKINLRAYCGQYKARVDKEDTSGTIAVSLRPKADFHSLIKEVALNEEDAFEPKTFYTEEFSRCESAITKEPGNNFCYSFCPSERILPWTRGTQSFLRHPLTVSGL
jgi:hypothetical protein